MLTTAQSTLFPVDDAAIGEHPDHSARPVPADLARISPRLAAYFAATELDRPTLAVDLALIEARYDELSSAFSGCETFYAVKANPAPEIVSRLIARGARLDCASRNEIAFCLGLGANAADICFGNTIKKESEIAWAHAHGVTQFAFDSVGELEKLARSAPGAQVLCRLISDGAGAEWPLSRKFGCSTAMAVDLLQEAREAGLIPYGVAFHVGSQQTEPERWTPALIQAREVFDRLEREAGIRLDCLNLGGGMPARYRSELFDLGDYGARVMASVREIFAGLSPRLIIEPGRGLVADAGVIQAEVVLVSRKDESETQRWVYLDIGKFSGLAETMDEAIKYRLVTARDGGATGPVILAGPSCDSADILYEKSGYALPLDLQVGDKVWILSAGAYTTTYSSIGFNGIPPLETVCV
ncbi:MAG: type III PLP-dependent enzyme [Rhodospirillaceae bacterium]|jgi:ornithine decarboxylase|nr:type III PLP-dependent enzyme [Rhodospirillaceae bacterium]MBT6140137.1 type III PLP-dependent enzyme [Rhodospirillaceae bacterium]MBT7355885.1 type III PLP-dependent enzyme [Rhodospirillaceae bacterium]